MQKGTLACHTRNYLNICHVFFITRDEKSRVLSPRIKQRYDICSTMFTTIHDEWSLLYITYFIQKYMLHFQNIIKLYLDFVHRAILVVGKSRCRRRYMWGLHYQKTSIMRCFGKNILKNLKNVLRKPYTHWLSSRMLNHSVLNVCKDI